MDDCRPGAFEPQSIRVAKRACWFERNCGAGGKGSSDGVGFGGGFRSRFPLRAGDADAHEEETEAFAEGIHETHEATFREKRT